MSHSSFSLLRDPLCSLVRTGRRILTQFGETDSLGRRIVYLMHRCYYCSITAVDWEDFLVDLETGLFFRGWYRPARWWTNFSFWDWQTPSHPKWVTRESFALLRGAQKWQIQRVLSILRRSRVISANEFHGATMLGVH